MFLEMPILVGVTRQEFPNAPLTRIAISIQPPDSCCLMYTCKIPAKSLQIFSRTEAGTSLALALLPAREPRESLAVHMG